MALVATVAVLAVLGLLLALAASGFALARRAQERALRAERAAGIALQGLISAATNPTTDRDTAAFLGAYLHDLRAELDRANPPPTSRELP